MATGASLGLKSDQVANTTLFSATFFGFLLTGMAVILGFSFGDTGDWPSLTDIDAHIAFRHWLLLGGGAAVMVSVGFTTDNTVLLGGGDVAWLAADVIGVLSFLRLFRLATPIGRRRILTRSLEEATSVVLDSGQRTDPCQRLLANDSAITAFRTALDSALARSDGAGLMDLTTQLQMVRPGRATFDALFAVEIDAAHRIARAVLYGRLDAIFGANAFDGLIADLSRRACLQCSREGEPSAPHRPSAGAAALGDLSRYLAWLANAALVLAHRGVVSTNAVRQLVSTCLKHRAELLRIVDPAPKNVATLAGLGSPLSRPVDVLLWLRDFLEFQGPYSGSAQYAAYQLLTGDRYEGNYFDGDFVLGDLRSALYGSDGSTMDLGARADATRCFLPTVQDFDEFMSIVAVGTLGTYRSRSVGHPPELTFEEFTSDRRLFAAYVNSIGGLAGLATSEAAFHALTQVFVSRESLAWRSLEEVDAYYSWRTPVPRHKASHRVGAAILVVALRLSTGSEYDENEVAKFFDLLGDEACASASKVAARIGDSPGAAAEASGHRGHCLDFVRSATFWVQK